VAVVAVVAVYYAKAEAQHRKEEASLAASEPSFLQSAARSVLVHEQVVLVQHVLVLGRASQVVHDQHVLVLGRAAQVVLEQHVRVLVRAEQVVHDQPMLVLGRDVRVAIEQQVLYAPQHVLEADVVHDHHWIRVVIEHHVLEASQQVLEALDVLYHQVVLYASVVAAMMYSVHSMQVLCHVAAAWTPAA
jgi:hypothetical protein